ncbi:SDR family NAD(P)-dependent oxidoreductase [Kitasatospora sp. NPDC001119]
MNIDLTGRTALVTGAASEVGCAIAAVLANSGATVVVTDEDRRRTADTVDRLCEISASTDITGFAAAFDTSDGIDALLAAVSRVDVLVNTSTTSSTASVLERPDAEWRRFFETEVLSRIRLARHYLPGMVKRGWGRVVFVDCEPTAWTPMETMHSGFTRSAHLAATSGLAQTVAETGVTVNSVLSTPGRTAGSTLVNSEIVEDFPHELVQGVLTRTETASYRNQNVHPEEIAEVVRYAASDHAKETTGSAWRIDGRSPVRLMP